mmetsp:Transcript_118117/g.330727  ORF Transcript_118117/g.330727 Transcript_118117/m.330727 type:complete len:216 (+) Transcript_118117:534-1181(+)
MVLRDRGAPRLAEPLLARLRLPRRRRRAIVQRSPGPPGVVLGRLELQQDRRQRRRGAHRGPHRQPHLARAAGGGHRRFPRGAEHVGGSLGAQPGPLRGPGRLRQVVARAAPRPSGGRDLLVERPGSNAGGDAAEDEARRLPRCCLLRRRYEASDSRCRRRRRSSGVVARRPDRGGAGRRRGGRWSGRRHLRGGRGHHEGARIALRSWLEVHSDGC